MDRNNLLAVIFFIALFAGVSYASYAGIGLKDQNADQDSIRQESATNPRVFRGGGTGFGK